MFILWMVGILHHFEAMGNHCLLAFAGESSFWCFLGGAKWISSIHCINFWDSSKRRHHRRSRKLLTQASSFTPFAVWGSGRKLLIFQAGRRALRHSLSSMWPLHTPTLPGSYCGWTKSCTTRKCYLQTNHHSRVLVGGAGLRPSTVRQWEPGIDE